MGTQVYSKAEYIIIKVSNCFIIINRKKGFASGHSHIKSFSTAKYLIDLAIHKSIPNHLSQYLLISLSRISEDREYQAKIEALLKNKGNRKQRYRRSA